MGLYNFVTFTCYPTKNELDSQVSTSLFSFDLILIKK